VLRVLTVPGTRGGERFHVSAVVVNQPLGAKAGGVATARTLIRMEASLSHVDGGRDVEAGGVADI
jgi:hypothetical protein